MSQASSCFYPEVYEFLGYQHAVQRPMIETASSTVGLPSYHNIDTSTTEVPNQGHQLPMVAFQRSSTGDEQPYEEETLHMLHFFLCQLRAQCEKILGAEVAQRFDAEMHRLDPELGSRDIIAAQVCSECCFFICCPADMFSRSPPTTGSAIHG
jgi:hypothetical protein